MNTLASRFSLNVEKTLAGKLYQKGDPRVVRATYHGKATCPVSCPLADGNGCFGWGNARVALAGTKTREIHGASFEEMLAWLRSLPEGSLVRLAVVGEALPKASYSPDVLDVYSCARLAEACDHLHVWTYTHVPLRPEDDRSGWDAWAENVEILSAINKLTHLAGRGLVVNASANSPEHAAALERHLAGTMIPVAFVCRDADDARRAGFACPATVKENRTCATCVGPSGVPLCARPDRKRAVGFPAHGGNPEQVRRALRVVQGAA